MNPVFKYLHSSGSWSVTSEMGRYLDYCTLRVWDGQNSWEVPLLPNDRQVRMAVHKLEEIPKGRIRVYKVFCQCVAGALSISMKYGR